VKLPGWVRRPPYLTPLLYLGDSDLRPDGPDTSTLLDRANDVAYKMIGGAYGVLGAEVLGHFVPRVLDETRWGIYVREAGVAWLCRELAPDLTSDSGGELTRRMARCVAAHHYVHCAVEAAVLRTHGEATYLDMLVKQSPRHGVSEERLGEMRFRLEALARLDQATRRLLETPLDALMARTPEGNARTTADDVAAVIALVNTELSVEIPFAGTDLENAEDSVPTYLVMEPHLPEPLASSIRQALLS
jgi:hypothetical protein